MKITNIAVLGSGLMGSSLAAHFAGCGFKVLLLDLASEGSDKNKIARESLDRCLANKPSNIFHKKFRSNITTGNFDEDLKSIKDSDWILEAIVENLEIKKSLYEKIESFRRPGTLITSNTSGIPIHLLAEGRSEDFKKCFLGTHFFNPPRYLRLLEIIPTSYTNPEITEFFLSFGKVYLGKEVIVCKDAPGFVANRIGVVSMAKIFQLTKDLGIPIDVADKLTGPALGRPKSGTFRLTDIVGLDTAVKVINDLQKNCPNDPFVQQMKLPEFIQFLIDNKFFGDKSSQGFYKKTTEKDEKGKPIILQLNLNSLEYERSLKPASEALNLSKQIEDLPKRLNAIIKSNDAGAELIKKSLAFLLSYSSHCIPEIAENFYSIDLAMRNGYGWEYGPFEYWDLIGFDKGLELIHSENLKAADWIYTMQKDEIHKFYSVENESLHYFNVNTHKFQELSGQQNNIQLSILEKIKTVYENPELKLIDIGNGVLCAEFRSKHNAIGEGILNGLNQSIKIAEHQNWKGLVIGNNANNFTVGANIMLIGMLAFQQEYDQLDMAVRLFQNTSMRMRYSKIPVVMATQGYVFGGGTEFLMHCDSAVCAAESYIGLVEVGVGLIPGGGGTKEFALRLSQEIQEGSILIPQLIQKFKTIATASVATSAFEAYDYGYLIHNRDSISYNNQMQISLAKDKVLELSKNYLPPVPQNQIMVLGRTGLGSLNAAAHSLLRGAYASDHDIKIAKKIAYVLCGGDLSYPQNVTEQYLLDIEREAFLSLCAEPKTLERIQYMLENNRPLRN
ncbi:MAG: 3-hydroxyacyl-CoA dehydrogenase/enoyl-CoA hydratase family protein [Saprospiraceae bacterium]|nr:3-hydroxyacyl-CoA dehydrogenase/enoyl-CoA hydratase family protein [Saprospiraceae bacterium]